MAANDWLGKTANLAKRVELVNILFALCALYLLRINELTVNYEEDGILLVKEIDKVILSKGAWTTILYRYQNWSRANEEYGKEMYTIRRYQKRQGDYIPKSKFNISSSQQAQKIITALQNWVEDEKTQDWPTLHNI